MGRASGGLLLGINMAFRHEILELSFWWIIVRIILDDWSFILCNIYFSPSLQLQHLLDALQLTINDIRTTHQHELLVLGGDFNARFGEQGTIHEDALKGSSLHSLVHR